MTIIGATSISWRWLMSTSILVLLVRICRTYARRYRIKNKEGCRPARKTAPVRDPFVGFDFVYENLFGKAVHNRLTMRHKTFRRFGQTYCIQRWSHHTVHTCDSRNVKHMLANRFADFVLPELRNRAIASFLGFGIFSLNGPTWSRVRSVLRPGFSKNNVDGIPDIVERHLRALWKQIPSGNKTIDLQPLFFELSMDVATEFLMGHSTSELQASNSRSRNHQFVSDYYQCSEAVVKKLRLGPLQFLVGNLETAMAKERIFKYVDNFIEEAKQRGVNKRMTPKYDILSELQKMTLDHQTLRDQVLHILLASRDTVACLLSNLVFSLSKHPVVYSRLREEVIGIAGQDQPSIDQLHSMKYLKWCVNESLRLHPVIPTNAREAVVDTTLPFGGGHDGNSPLFIKKGMLVIYNAYSMHRNPEVFGDDIEMYVPERWESLRPGWDFLPFNGGPRVCIGQQFALTETYYVMARMAQRFATFESRDERVWEEREALAVTCKHGVLVGLSEARSARKAG